MTRNIKAMGLALVAMLAISAMVASGASATETNAKFTAAQYPAFFHGESKAGVEKFSTEAGTVECAGTFTGTAEEASKVIKVTPTYTGCKAFGFLSASVVTTGCQYEFKLTTEETVSGTEDPVYKAHVNVVCEAGKSIKITASTCAAEVKAQEGLTTVDLHNMTGVSPKDVTVRPTVGTDPAPPGNAGIAYTVTSDGFLCPFGGTGNKTGGTYTSTEALTVRGYKDSGGVKGEQINIDIG